MADRPKRRSSAWFGPTDRDGFIHRNWVRNQGLPSHLFFNDDRSQIALWGRNLANEIYFIQAGGLVSTFGTSQQFTGPPPMWGAEISHRF